MTLDPLGMIDPQIDFELLVLFLFLHLIGLGR